MESLKKKLLSFGRLAFGTLEQSVHERINEHKLGIRKHNILKAVGEHFNLPVYTFTRTKHYTSPWLLEFPYLLQSLKPPLYRISDWLFYQTITLYQYL